eukprot:scaffold9.g3151.t1
MTAGPETAVYKLPQGHELRLEVDWSKKVFVKLTEGSAEVFGSALELGERVGLSGQKVAVYTWQGATLEVTGQPDVIYESDETPMPSYLNVHDALEARRQAAQQAEQQQQQQQQNGGAEAGSGRAEGPRCFVVGPTDSGKSTLCKILINYAVRQGWAPTMVDLDIGQGSITAPGCLAATPVEAPVDIEEGFPVDAPLVYYYGHTTPSENPGLYRHLVERLGAVLELRASQDAQVRAAGLMINSMGWVEDLGYELLLHTIRTLKVDVVLVVGSERLHSQLAGDMRSKKGISVVKLARSGGVVTRPKELRQATRKARVEEYFYGVGKQLAPASQTARLEDVEVYRVGGGPRAPSSALPIGATSVADPLRLSRLGNPQELLYTLVAVSHAPEPELLLSANVAGFIYVQDVDLAQGTLTYLAPRPGPLPSKYLLAGSFKTYLD